MRVCYGTTHACTSASQWLLEIFRTYTRQLQNMPNEMHYCWPFIQQWSNNLYPQQLMHGANTFSLWEKIMGLQSPLFHSGKIWRASEENQWAAARNQAVHYLLKCLFHSGKIWRASEENQWAAARNQAVHYLFETLISLMKNFTSVWREPMSCCKESGSSLSLWNAYFTREKSDERLKRTNELLQGIKQFTISLKCLFHSGKIWRASEENQWAAARNQADQAVWMGRHVLHLYQ